jgi:deazaflavin-dependent oxidoreductase (nitroreductase family)
MDVVSKCTGRLFRAVNTVVDPVARRGWLAPGPLGAGVVVLDTVGRRSGQPRSTPLLAARVGGRLVVGTVRGGSDWMANLGADPSPVVTTRGGPVEVVASLRALRPVGTVAVLRVGRDTPA